MDIPNFDILSSNAPGAQATQGSQGAGFDILSNAYNRPQVGPNGQPLAVGAPPGQPVQQQQGAPVSGLMAGILGMPQYSGAVPGAAYLTPGQAQPNGGQQQSSQPQNIGGLLGQLIYAGQNRGV